MGRETWTANFQSARCCDCGWEAQSDKNAVGLAAQHHDKTGHRVDAEQTTTIRYGENTNGPR